MIRARRHHAGYHIRVALAVAASAIVGGLLIAPIAAAASPPVHDAEWFIGKLKLDQAHQISTGKGVTVAVVDSGVDAGHPDLAGHVLPAVDVSGVKAGSRVDLNGHGTVMAAIIAAQGGGENNALGIAPGANILPVTAGGEEFTSDLIAKGIRAAVQRGAKVVNLSIGSNGGYTNAERTAVSYAVAHNVIVVGAAGNRRDGDIGVDEPANIPGVIAVTGLGKNGFFWPGSTQGPEAVLSAPAEDIVTATSRQKYDSGYGEADGTSCSAAFISGLAALVWSEYPELDANNVINRLIKTSKDLGPPGRDPQYGFGGLQVIPALTASVPPISYDPLLPRPSKSASASSFSASDYDTGGWTPISTAIAALVGLGLVTLVTLLIIRAKRHPAGGRPSPQPSLPGGSPPWTPGPGGPVPGAGPGPLPQRPAEQPLQQPASAPPGTPEPKRTQHYGAMPPPQDPTAPWTGTPPSLGQPPPGPAGGSPTGTR